ncbi:MAG: sigma-70 family RNA polymerase sigma factor [Planctomycetaceae bacterium]|nr:sigma-70 family RNA polymerase sigma factor [Planctomycetaceae bacterium]
MQNSDSPRTVEPWKLELVRKRARRMGFQAADIDDAVQEIYFELLDFKYDPAGANAATEETVVTRLIDNRLRMMRRKETRYQNRLEEIHHAARPAIHTTVDEPDERQEPAYEECPSAVLDVRDALTSLDAPERVVCKLLGEGNTIRDVARILGCSQTTVRTHVDKIREQFSELGLHLWVIRDEPDEEEPTDPLLLTARKAAAMCGKSIRTWRTWDSAGFIPQPVRIGRSTFWRSDELKEWIEAGCPNRSAWEVMRSET